MTALTTAPRFADAKLRTGVRLRYAELGDPAGHPLILLHGYTDSWFSFSRVLPELAETFHVYALDQRGHGDSERPADGYSMRTMAADVVAFMDAEGLQRATLIGHSMGTFVARQAALDAPERVASLVLLGSGVAARNDVAAGLQQAVGELSEPVPAEFVRAFQVSTIGLPVPDAFLDRVIAESLKLPLRVWRTALAGMLADDSHARLGELHSPTLLISGSDDAVFSQAEQDALLAALPAATLSRYPVMGHAPHWEQPAEVALAIASFVAASGTAR
jgi:pimeloyl-ACP methyl ester carboxylesterase